MFKNLLLTILLTLSGLAIADQQFDIQCETSMDSILKGVIGFDEIGWSEVGLPLEQNGKLKVFNYFKVGDNESLSFVDRTENGWEATNSFSYFSMMVVIAKAERRHFSKNENFKMSLFRRSYETPTGVAKFTGPEILKCKRLN